MFAETKGAFSTKHWSKYLSLVDSFCYCLFYLKKNYRKLNRIKLFRFNFDSSKIYGKRVKNHAKLLVWWHNGPIQISGKRNNEPGLDFEQNKPKNVKMIIRFYPAVLRIFYYLSVLTVFYFYPAVLIIIIIIISTAG